MMLVAFRAAPRSQLRSAVRLVLLVLGLVWSTVLASSWVLGRDLLVDLIALRPAPAPADHRPSHCPVDPFGLPGVLHLNGSDASETRWIPLADPVSDATAAKFEEIVDQDGGPLGAEGHERLFAALATGKIEDFDWARDRVILLVGNSHDRNNVEHIAQILESEYTSWGIHTGGFTRVAALNLTLVHYFLVGMVDSETADWFRPDEPRPITWETRLPINEALRRQAGIGEPALTLFASMYWDEYMFKASRQRARIHPAESGLTIPEARWHSARVTATLEHLAALYPSSRLMLRTRHRRLKEHSGLQLRIFQLDASGRAAASRVPGVLPFEWGNLLEGFEGYKDNDQHWALGPPAYLAGEMLLFYLRQAVIPGCWLPL